MGQPAQNAWPSIFSPDGQKLLLGSNFDNSPALYVLNLADLAIVRLTQMAETGSWSPDGAMVAFAWYNFGMRGYEPPRYGLEVVSVDGTTRQDVAAAVRTASGRLFEPRGLVTWSADGSEIAVLDHTDGQFYAIRLDGSGLRPVTSLFEPYGYATLTSVESVSWGAVKTEGR